jgi:Ca-activated chloride channel family protein
MPAEFHFLRPAWLLLLPLLLGLVPLLCRARAAGGAWRRVIDPALLPHLLDSVAPRRRCLPALLLGLFWGLVVLALAGPTWEREPTPLLEARQFHVVLLDLSPSMNAADLAPSRLARARFEVLDLLRIAGEGQTALVAFGAEPYLVAPLTGDAETIALQVPLLETGLLPVPGERRTDLALALAGELLEGAAAPSGSVVLVSDGLAPRAASLEAAARLRGAGHRVHVLAVGTAAGAPLLQDGGRLLREADGAVRLARLDQEGLRALAAAGGGLYRPASSGDGDVQALVDAAVRDRAEGGEDAVERWRDLGPWLILAALPLALLGFRRGWLGPLLLVFVVMPPQAVRAGAWDDLWLTPDQQGVRALEQGRAGAALELFERPDWRAAAAHAAGDYAAALQALEGLPPAQSAYNRGNLLARQGDYAAAIEAYEAALAANPQDDDARHNRDLLRDLLARRQPSAQDPQAQSAADAAEDPSQDGSQDQSGETGQDQSAQQDGDGAEQGGDSGEAGDAAASGGGSDDGDARSGEAGSGEPGDGETTSAGDTGSTAADSGDSAGSESADQGTQGTAGDGAEAGSDASASPSTGAGEGSAAGAQAQGGEQGQGSGAAGGAQAAGEGGDRPSRGQGGADDAAAGDSEGAQAGADAGAGEGLPGSEPQDAADRADAADGADGDAPGDKAVEGAGDPARTAGASAGEGAGADPGHDGPGADSPAGTEPDGQATVDSDGPGAGERGSEEAAQDRAGAAQPDAVSGGERGGTGGGQGDAPAGAGAGGPEPGPGSGSAAADAAAGGAAEGGALPGGASRGTVDSGRPGLDDLLGEGPPAGAGPDRRGVPGDGPDERRQALEQMLRTVEDDPGGLLRQRFLLQHLRRSGQLP